MSVSGRRLFDKVSETLHSALIQLHEPYASPIAVNAFHDSGRIDLRLAIRERECEADVCPDWQKRRPVEGDVLLTDCDALCDEDVLSGAAGHFHPDRDSRHPAPAFDHRSPNDGKHVSQFLPVYWLLQ